MRGRLAANLRKILVVALVGFISGGDMAAYAQSRECSQLSSTLNALTGNRDFRALQGNVEEARSQAAEIQDMESLFVRGGCQKQLNSGGRLSGQCRTLARRIINGRQDYNKIAARVETGQAVAQQREQALQQVARFGCSDRTRSNSRVEVRTRSNGSILDNLFDRLFGGDEFVDDSYDYFGGQSTLRTVCVRKCDGYYWPISFSTVGQFLEQDADLCQSQCPGAEVELFHYGNPGETPEQMVNINGTPYTSLPNAFAYRTSFNTACSCKRQIDFGTIVQSASVDGQPAQTIVTFENASFPLPIPDPRERKQEVVVADLIHLPLPLPRPLRLGEVSPETHIQPPVAETATRVIQSGGKTVRLVGPETIYAQSKAKGS